jgi:hypothetical protein
MDDMPSAIILARNPRTSSVDELKTYQGNEIFLNNGDEFQIRLFNPLIEKIGVQLSINGKQSGNLLVLNPGEDATIDRFIDDKRRMIFETYMYDESNPSAKKAVANNGNIEIKFFKERFQINTVNPNWYYSNSTTNITTTFGGTTATFTTSGNLNNLGTPQYRSDKFADNIFQSPGVFCCKTDLSHQTLDFADDFENNNVQEPIKMSSKQLKSLKETGIISKGAESDQNFKNVNVEFENFPFHQISYFLKPMSEKNSVTKEIREYCEICRYRIKKKSYLYCPKCGHKL